MFLQYVVCFWDGDCEQDDEEYQPDDRAHYKQDGAVNNETDAGESRGDELDDDGNEKKRDSGRGVGARIKTLHSDKHGFDTALAVFYLLGHILNYVRVFGYRYNK